MKHPIIVSIYPLLTQLKANKKFKKLACPIILWFAIWLPSLTSGQSIATQVLWEQGAGKYNNYRVPSLIVTQKGTTLAFCEGRETDDLEDIDLLARRSVDNGKNWGNGKLIYPGPAAYSCLTKLTNNKIGVLFEGGKGKAHKKIVLVTFKI